MDELEEIARCSAKVLEGRKHDELNQYEVRLVKVLEKAKYLTPTFEGVVGKVTTV